MNKKQATFWKPYTDLIGVENFHIDGIMVTSKFYSGIDDNIAISGGEATVDLCIRKYEEYHNILKNTVLTHENLDRIFLSIVSKVFFDEELVYLHSNYQIEQTIEEHWDLIMSCWRRQELNSSTKSRIENWKKIFSLRNSIPDLTNQLPNTFTAYRAGNPNGFSWTLDKDVALWFHQRLSKQFGYIPLLQKEFNKKDVIFYTNERTEQEVVIVPK